VILRTPAQQLSALVQALGKSRITATVTAGCHRANPANDAMY